MPPSPALRPVDAIWLSFETRQRSAICAVEMRPQVATRYDKLTESFAAFVLLASIRIWIKFVHAT
jgi:hypothetical protein